VWRKSSHSAASNCAEVAAWRKSAASAANGACAEVGAWRKSSASMSNGQCAEVGQGGAVVGVRDSRDPDGAVLAFPAQTWAAFLVRLRSAKG
jgi:hypothetical protein